MLKIHEEIEIEQVKVAPKALYPDFIDSSENKDQFATDGHLALQCATLPQPFLHQ